jgi:sialate O-acetylesterase
MVIQRNTPFTVWGTADFESSVEILFDKKSYTATIKKGEMQITLPAFKAGGPYEMKIIGSQTIIISDIYFGDVFVCGGQSNMEWPMEKINNAESEIKDGNYPLIRHLTVNRIINNRKSDDLNVGSWQKSDTSNIKQLTAIGFLMSRNLIKEHNIPIGIIDNSWGGTNIAGWMPEEAFANMESYNGKIKEFQSSHIKFDQLGSLEREWIQSIDLLDEGTPNGYYDPHYPRADWKEYINPGSWEEKGYKNKDGIFWFAKDFQMTRQKGVDSCLVSLGKIDDGDITYINGVVIGSNDNAYDIERLYYFESSLLDKMRNEIVVRIKDTGGAGGMYSPAEDLYLECGTEKISLAGMWKIEEGTKSLKPLVNTGGPNAYPTNRYNGMVNPLMKYPIAAYLYYQGESDAANYKDYTELFKRMILTYRKNWNNNKLPFIFVQLANFMPEDIVPVESNWAEIRDAQKAALSLPYTAMVSTIDVGVANDIHPRDKQTVAKRMTAAVNRLVYNKAINYSGPNVNKMNLNKGGIEVIFEDAGRGLDIRGNQKDINGFIVKTIDDKLIRVKASKFTNNSILLQYTKPFKEVRYLWANNPGQVQIYDYDGFPALPFRSKE